MKRIWLQLLAALLICAVLVPCAFAESLDVEEPVEELDEFIIGGDNGESIEGIEEAEPAAEEEPEMIEIGLDGSVLSAGADEVLEPGTEGGTGLIDESKDGTKTQYYQTRLLRTGSLGTLTFTKGDMLLVIPDFATNAGVSVTGFTSSKTNVASIDSRGWITTYAEGTTKITVTTTNKKVKATLKLKVVDPYKPSKIYINQGKNATLYLRQTIQLTTRLEPVSAKADLTWTSSKPAVATVDGNGRVTAQGEGTAKITVKTHNGKKATFKVKVEGIYVNPNVHYRALVIGQCTFPWSNASNLPGDKDANMMEKMLLSVRGPEGNNWVVTKRTDRTYNQIYSDIRTAFAGATNNDVSLFYYSGHGNESSSYYSRPYSCGALLTHDDEMLSLHQLAEWLNEVPGKVIVLIDSCGSGAAVYGFNKAGGVEEAFDPESFDGAVVDAFASVDKGVSAPWSTSEGAFIVTNKFYVLTASRYQEYSWCSKKGSYFTQWISAAVKTKGKMPGDADKNKFITLNEMYNYVRAKSDKQTFRDGGRVYQQHTQVYPAYSGFQLFYRK